MTPHDQGYEDHPLGRCHETFGPSIIRIVAYFLLGVALIAGGVALSCLLVWLIYRAGGQLALAPGKEINWPAAGLIGFPAVAVFVVGVMLVVYCYRAFSLRVEVHEFGFRYWWRGAAEDIRWTDIALIRETVWHERPPIPAPANLLLPKMRSSSYTVVTRAGKEYVFSWSVASLERLGKFMRDLAPLLSIPWERVEEHLS
jgi:hypothetical protein